MQTTTVNGDLFAGYTSEFTDKRKGIKRVPPMDAQYYWASDQPDRWSVALYPDHALMYKSTQDKLPEYSTTLPSGVYEGKMWKARQGDQWLLGWYGESDEPNQCSINFLPIVLQETLDLIRD